MRRADPDRLLGRAVAQLFDARVESCVGVPWASATFTGRQHRFVLREVRSPVDPVTLGDHDFSIRGHVVVDVRIVSDEAVPDGDGTTVVEALTVQAE
jgi:hypothetical protein